jgi:hypothetical protein
MSKYPWQPLLREDLPRNIFVDVVDDFMPAQFQRNARENKLGVVKMHRTNFQSTNLSKCPPSTDYRTPQSATRKPAEILDRHQSTIHLTMLNALAIRNNDDWRRPASKSVNLLEENAGVISRVHRSEVAN